MSIVAGLIVALSVFAALIYGVPPIFASSGGGILLSAIVAYTAALTVTWRIAKTRDRTAPVVLLLVLVATAYAYMVVMDRAMRQSAPPFPGAVQSGTNQPRK
jgi:hypothetical protein